MNKDTYWRIQRDGIIWHRVQVHPHHKEISKDGEQAFKFGANKLGDTDSKSKEGNGNVD